jgi:MYXO-CTERM domain-containing protein
VQIRVAAAVAASLFACASGAAAGTVVSEKKSSPYPGVQLIERVESGPTNRIWISKISLCNDYVHVAATKAPASLRTPGSWGSGQGLQLATNGDFYTGTQVYGDAVGGGVPWPIAQTGKDKSGAWYYQKYGWIAFGPNWVEFSHTKQTKTVDAARFGVSFGWKPTEVTTAIPKGTQALVSGFPALVIEGQVYTCSSPTASSCFPDRSDMRARHPRTAMGITKDRKSFILAVVDGRTSISAGMYGSELAALMGKLGAWQAFNLDGGGSSAMWLASKGYVNNASGNNSGGGVRAVANHWGVYAGSGSGKSSSPGSCFVPGGCFPTAISGAEGEVFKDMPPGSFAHDEAITLFNHKITSGCQSSPRMFCPACALTRGQSVAMLLKAAGISTANPPAVPTFSDVPTTHTFFAAIEKAAALGITSGCGGGKFCPGDSVTRGQMAAFITRTTKWPLINPATPSFPLDVPRTHLFYKEIETTAKYCVTKGCGTDIYCPDRKVTRAEAAIFLVRAFDLDDANSCIGSGGTGTGGSGGSSGGSSNGGSSNGGSSSGGGGSTGRGGSGGSGGGSAGGDAGGSGEGSAGADSGGEGAAGGQAGSVGAGGEGQGGSLNWSGARNGGDDERVSDEEAGCACRVPSPAPNAPLSALVLALALARLRRRR